MGGRTRWCSVSETNNNKIIKMKKYFYTLILVAAGMVSACSGNNDFAASESLQVVSAETEIDANGGSAVIATVEKDVMAVASDSWLKVSVDNGRVTVSAGKNNSLESRHAIVTIKDGRGRQAIVNVSQLGVVLYVKNAGEQLITNDAERVLEYEVCSSTEATAYTKSEWVKAQIVGDRLVVNVAENADNAIRAAYVYFSNSVKTDSMRIVQGELKDVVGTYMLMGYDLEWNPQSVLVSIERGEDCPVCMKVAGNIDTMEDYGWTLPVTFDEKELTLNIFNVTHCGMKAIDDENSAYVATVMMDSSQGRMFYNAGYTMTAYFDIDDEMGTYAAFGDDGSMVGRNLDGFQFCTFKSLPASNQTAMNTVLTLVYPTLVRL